MSAATQETVTASTRLKNGDFVWYELRTPDAQSAQDFYTHVVGWTAKPSGDPGGFPYTLLNLGDAGIAGLVTLSPEMLANGVQAAWAGFIGVDDVDAYARRIEQAGGKVHHAPQDIPGIGRFAAVADPQGASFLLFHGFCENPTPRPADGTPGTIGWHELSANDEGAAWQFYSSLFGWEQDRTMDMGAGGIYRIFKHGPGSMGAMMTRNPNLSPAPFWLYYFFVEDIDAAATRIREKNGQIGMGPHEVPGSLWIIVGTDPQGVTFALVGPRK